MENPAAPAASLAETAMSELSVWETVNHFSALFIDLFVRKAEGGKKYVLLEDVTVSKSPARRCLRTRGTHGSEFQWNYVAATKSVPMFPMLSGPRPLCWVTDCVSKPPIRDLKTTPPLRINTT